MRVAVGSPEPYLIQSVYEAVGSHTRSRSVLGNGSSGGDESHLLKSDAQYY